MSRLREMKTPERANDPKVRLFVEGKRDKELLWECWLDELELIARGLPQIMAVEDTGSCSNVPTRVEGDLLDPDVIAMGLVDRDALTQSNLRAQRGLERFLQDDDARFVDEAPKVYEEKIARRMWVLRHWEMENLLLIDANALRKQQWASGPKPAAQFTDDEAVLSVLIELAVRHRAYFAAQLHGRELGKDVKLTDIHKGERDEPTLRRDLAAAHKAWINPARVEEIERLLSRFDEPGAATLQARWERLCRVVDGKLMLHWLRQRYIHDTETALPRQLASRLKERHGGPPPEMLQLLKEMRRRAKEISRERSESAT